MQNRCRYTRERASHKLEVSIHLFIGLLNLNALAPLFGWAAPLAVPLLFFRLVGFPASRYGTQLSTALRGKLSVDSAVRNQDLPRHSVPPACSGPSKRRLSSRRSMRHLYRTTTHYLDHAVHLQESLRSVESRQMYWEKSEK